jgi:hypothetical protein
MDAMQSRPRSTQIGDLHNQLVLVVTDAGIPVSIGRLMVTNDAIAPAVVRVEVVFETERLKCTLRVRAENWAKLIDEWDGEKTCYVLPHSDGFWLDERETSKRQVVAEFLRITPATRTKRRRPPN